MSLARALDAPSTLRRTLTFFHVAFTPPGPRLLYLDLLMCSSSLLTRCRAFSFFLLFGLFPLVWFSTCLYEIRSYWCDFPLHDVCKYERKTLSFRCQVFGDSSLILKSQYLGVSETDQLTEL
jgi:hypothetical protein